MQFTVKLTGTAPDTDAIEHALREVDPSAVVDVDPTGDTLRIAANLDSETLSLLISDGGHPVALADLERVPSTCCGGCGG